MKILNDSLFLHENKMDPSDFVFDILMRRVIGV